MNTYADKEQESTSMTSQHNYVQREDALPETLTKNGQHESGEQENQQPWMSGTHNPLQMRISTQNPLQPGTSTQNPLKPMVSNQNPLKPMTSTQNPLQLLAKQSAPGNNPLQMHAQPDGRQEPVQKKSNNTGLPDKLKEGVENLSGFSMDDVKVHYNSDKPAQLQALAYAQGTDIHLGPGQEKHLPHEAWHVVQQKQGRVQPTMQMKGNVAVNDDKGLESEADVMGGRAISIPGSSSNPHSSQILSMHSETKHAKTIVQRFESGERPFAEGYTNVLNDPQWMPKAEAYEQRLGTYTYNSRQASTSLHSAVIKMHEVFKKYYQTEFAKDEATILKKLFFRDDKTSAGQVGLNLDLDKMLLMLGEGNLRERMTAFYNASYYGAGYGGNIAESFKAILQDIVINKKWDQSNMLNLNTKSLQKENDHLGSYSRSAIHGIVSTISEERAYNYAEDIFALGNITYQTDTNTLANTRETALSQKNRNTRDAAEKNKHRKTSDRYQNMGTPLSDRELAYVFPDKKRESILDKMFYTEENFRRAHTGSDPLPWEEGTVMFEITPDASWYKKIHDGMKMPVVAGVSGTTARMLKSFEWLNTGANVLNFRLGIMGWMLTSWDHSLYEILRGSHIAGVKGADEEKAIQDVVHMYMNIPPLSVAELREKVAENGMFPHEFIYHKHALEKDSSNPQSIVPGTSPMGEDVANKGKMKIYNSGRKKSEYENLSEAHAIAIYSYTSGAHNILNSVMSFNFSETLAKKEIQRKLGNIINHEAEKFLLKEKKRKGTISLVEKKQLAQLESHPVEWINVLTPKLPAIQKILGNPDISDEKREIFRQELLDTWLVTMVNKIYPELQMHANMTVEGLKNLPAVSGITVWRGDWISNLSIYYNQGSLVNFSTFTSFSKQRTRGEGFSTSGNFSTKMLIKLELKGIAGKDISGLSMYQSEEEVLLMPGASMKIIKAGWGKIGRDDVWMVEAEEV